MNFNFENLDLLTRCLMFDEIHLDIGTNSLYLPECLNQNGKSLYEILLKKAIGSGNDVMLAEDLKKYNCVDFDQSKNISEIDIGALAQAEFNRYYIRALCKRVINNNKGRLEIYSALQSVGIVDNSKLYIGKVLEPNTTLNTLREKNKLTGDFSRGLSVRIV